MLINLGWIWPTCPDLGAVVDFSKTVMFIHSTYALSRLFTTLSFSHVCADRIVIFLMVPIPQTLVTELASPTVDNVD